VALEKQFLFIIGAARSGTTWLQAMVAAHPSICSTTDELKLFDLFTGPWTEAWQFLLRLQETVGGGRYGLTGVWSEAQFYDFLTEFVDRVYTQVLALKPEATVILDKTPGYSNYVEHINRIIPHAKFIHLVRDGRDVVVSMQAASRGWGRLWAPEKMESNASLWKTTVLAARKAQQYSDRYLEVRYEELLSNGVRELREIFDFIGVPIDAETVTTIFTEHQFEKMKQVGAGVRGFSLPEGFFRKGQAGEWRNALSPSQRYIFHDTAGDLLCALGYADKSWWIDRAYQRFTLPLLAMLSNQNRMQVKIHLAIKRALGPLWTERFRAARLWLRHGGRSESRRAEKVTQTKSNVG
jgi:Sulfotransferase family